MRKLKITVLKKEFDEELCKEYADPAIEICPVHEVGQVMYVVDGKAAC